MKPRCNKLNIKYADALKLYRETDKSQKEICVLCNVSLTGFRTFIQTHCRDDLMKRYKMNVKKNVKLHGKQGQGINAHYKYRDAVKACDSEDFITYSVSQIARFYNVSPTGLGNQLRMHFPDILERRRNARIQMGLKNHLQEGVKAQHIEKYRRAVLMLSSGDITIKEAAERCNVSFSGLRQHVIYYHRALAEKRQKVRESNKKQKLKGCKNGNNMIHEPGEETKLKYLEALDLYINTGMSIKEIAKLCFVSESGFEGYLRKWHPEYVIERRNFVSSMIGNNTEQEHNNRCLKSTVLKYAEAITMLRDSDMTIAAVAKLFLLNVSVFRQYVKKHHPDIASRNGMILTTSGSRMSRRSYEKYKEAIDMYLNSNANIHAIASQLGLNYNSLLYFIKRNYKTFRKQ